MKLLKNLFVGSALVAKSMLQMRRYIYIFVLSMREFNKKIQLDLLHSNNKSKEVEEWVDQFN